MLRKQHIKFRKKNVYKFPKNMTFIYQNGSYGPFNGPSIYQNGRHLFTTLAKIPPTYLEFWNLFGIYAYFFKISEEFKNLQCRYRVKKVGRKWLNFLFCIFIDKIYNAVRVLFIIMTRNPLFYRMGECKAYESTNEWLIRAIQLTEGFGSTKHLVALETISPLSRHVEYKDDERGQCNGHYIVLLL